VVPIPPSKGGFIVKRKIVACAVTVALVLTVFGALLISSAPPSSSASVVTASSRQDPYTVSIGQNMMWSGWQFNVHDSGVRADKGNPTISQSSTGSTLITKVATSSAQAQDYGSNCALLGVQFHVKGVNTQADWQAVAAKPVTITARVSYALSAKGSGTGMTSVTADIGFNSPPYTLGTEPIAATYCHYNEAEFVKSGAASSAITTVKFTTLVGALGGARGGTPAQIAPGDARIIVQIGENAAWSQPGGNGLAQATATVYVYDIQLSWS
jgi:hypothetical protein